MEKALTINDVAEMLSLSYGAVYSHRHKWGFFQMEDSRSWRVYPSDLDKNRKKQNNSSRLEVQIGDKENLKCRSTKNRVVSGGLISGHRAAQELGTRLEQLKRNLRKNTTTN